MGEVRGVSEEEAVSDRQWCRLRISSSETRRSKSRTSRNSRSILPTSRFPNTPVHSAQCTFFNVESLRYWIGDKMRPREGGNGYGEDVLWTQS